MALPFNFNNAVADYFISRDMKPEAFLTFRDIRHSSALKPQELARFAYQKKHLKNLHRLSKIFDLAAFYTRSGMHFTPSPEITGFGAAVPSFMAKELSALRYSDDTYHLIADIVRTTALSFYTGWRNGRYTNIDFSNPNDRLYSLYADVNAMFADQAQTIMPNLEKDALKLSSEYPDALGWTAINSHRRHPKLRENEININKKYESKDTRMHSTLNTIIHETSHRFMNSLYLFLHDGERLDVSPYIKLDIYTYKLLYDSKLISISDICDKNYEVYRSSPDERLAFYAGNSFETWIRIFENFEAHNIDILRHPEHLAAANQIFETCEPRIKAWADDKPHAETIMQGFFLKLQNG